MEPVGQVKLTLMIKGLDLSNFTSADFDALKTQALDMLKGIKGYNITADQVTFTLEKDAATGTPHASYITPSVTIYSKKG